MFIRVGYGRLEAQAFRLSDVLGQEPAARRPVLARFPDHGRLSPTTRQVLWEWGCPTRAVLTGANLPYAPEARIAV